MGLRITWMFMQARCSPDADTSYSRQGIEIRWTSFDAFKEWAVTSGYAPGLTLDRIDPAGHYEPSNCRWVTRRENLLLRHGVYRTAFGETKSLIEWSEDERCRVSYTALHRRVQRLGWDLERALTTPVKSGPRQHCRRGHVMDESNARKQKSGRYCGRCHDERMAARYQRTKTAR